MSRSAWEADTVAIGRGHREDAPKDRAPAAIEARPDSAEGSIGSDAVAIGRGKASDSSRVRQQRERAPKLKASAPVSWPVLGCAAAAAIVVALVAVLTGGSTAPKAPIREVADPAPRPAVERPRQEPTRLRRREARPPSSPALKRQPKGKLEQRGRKPGKATKPTPEHAEKAAPPPPEPEYVPPPEPEPEPEPEYVPPPESPAAAPTPPGNEFGL
jgi:hypothetical protein